ncbi:MAG: sodium:calcium antiporter [Armatimonadia bacterium]
MSELAGPSFVALIALGVILAGCELFTNGIEWVGCKLNLSCGAVGSVLAAVGTALPETLVPIVALLVVKGEHSNAIGIGAILGAPFMLGTLAFLITGLAAIVYHKRGRRGLELSVDPHTLGQDMGYFLGVYIFAIGLSFVPAYWMRLVGAALLLGAYVVYVRRHFQRECDTSEADMNPLYLCRRLDVPRLRFVLLQVVVALSAIFFGAELFVRNIEALSSILATRLLGWDAATVALLLSLTIIPIATELPEKFNSVLWVGRGKDTLAMGNITGAMVFQSCIPVTVGVLLTPWHLEPRALASAAAALLSVTVVFLAMRTRHRLSPYVLLLGGPLYAGWLWYALQN